MSPKLIDGVLIFTRLSGKKFAQKFGKMGQNRVFGIC